ncbi:MAG: HTTM domain-containing protein [Verrucomicrobiota bacterium]
MEEGHRFREITHALWLRQVDESHYALVRFVFSIVALISLGMLWPYRHAFYSDQGMIDQGAALAETRYFYLSVFGVVRSAPAVTAYFVFSAGAMVCLALGWAPRLAALCVFIWVSSCALRAPVAVTGWDLVLRSFAFLILVSPLGKAWKLGGSWLPKTISVPVYGITLMQLQVLVIYWQTVIGRLQDTWWMNGEFFAFFMLSHHSRWPGLWVVEMMPLMRLLTWGTLVFEMVLPILLFVPRTRWWGIVLGIIFHLAIVVASNNITMFSLTMIMTYFVFLREADISAISAWLRRKGERGRAPLG